MILAKPGGEEIDRTLGFVKPKEFIKTINDYQRGIGTLAAMIKAEPDNALDPKFLFEIGEKFYAHSQWDKADARFQSVIMIDNSNKNKVTDQALFKRVLICRKLKKWDDGIALCRKLTDTYVESELVPDAAIYAAFYAAEAGRPDEAVKGYKAYIKKWPKGEDAEWAAEQIKELTKPETTEN